MLLAQRSSSFASREGSLNRTCNVKRAAALRRLSTVARAPGARKKTASPSKADAASESYGDLHGIAAARAIRTLDKLSAYAGKCRTVGIGEAFHSHAPTH